MKGFYIEITNNLLETKHRKAMKESVWLFMWLLDKMTSISEEGIGKVLGGKPITYEEINKELGISRPTYIRWVELLKKGEYINTLRTPRGLVFSINKAKKRFGRDVSKMKQHNKEKKRSDVSNSDSDVSKTDSEVSNSDIQYKTVSKTINKDNNKEREAKLSPAQEMRLFLEGKEHFTRLVGFIVEKSGMPQDKVTRELMSFKGYWTELTKNGKKQRWELQPTFQLQRRLNTWFRNAGKFNTSNKKQIII